MKPTSKTFASMSNSSNAGAMLIRTGVREIDGRKWEVDVDEAKQVIDDLHIQIWIGDKLDRAGEPRARVGGSCAKRQSKVSPA